jgi:hypothetical protein
VRDSTLLPEWDDEQDVGEEAARLFNAELKKTKKLGRSSGCKKLERRSVPLAINVEALDDAADASGRNSSAAFLFRSTMRPDKSVVAIKAPAQSNHVRRVTASSRASQSATALSLALASLAL